MAQDITLVYMVAGMSSRFGGKIKQFAQVGPHGETLIEYSLKQALNSRFTKIVFVVGDKTEAGFKQVFGNKYHGIPIVYAMQKFNPAERDKPWGTTDALVSARAQIDSPCVVCNGDDLYGESAFKMLVQHLVDKEGEATIGYPLVETLSEQGSVNRGIFSVDEAGRVSKIFEALGITRAEAMETPGIENVRCSMNLFALHPETIDRLALRLESFKAMHKKDRTAECLLPTEISTLIEKKDIRMKLYPAHEKWIGVTYPEDEAVVKEILASAR